MKMTSLLKFGKGNAKLGKSVWTFSLPSGYSCPCALLCLSKANRETGKIKDGVATEFRCFSASAEALYPAVRKQRWHNFEALKGLTREQMASLIELSLPVKANVVRIHIAGDFFSQAYFDAWLAVAKRNPSVLFYAYTKSLSFWLARRSEVPTNFVLTASRGGKQDNLIKTNGLREAIVVYSVKEAEELGIPIDHDDSHAMAPTGDFALLVHGTQPAGSKAASAKSLLKGEGGYSRKKAK